MKILQPMHANRRRVQEILASVHFPLAGISAEHPEHVRGVQCLLQLCIRDLIFTAASNDTFSHSTIQQQSLKRTFANPLLYSTMG